MINFECRKLGFTCAIVAIVLFYILPENGETLDGFSLSGKLHTNFNGIRSYLADRAVCIYEKCIHLISSPKRELLEVLFQMCLSPWNYWEKAKVHLAVVACGDRLEETLVNIKSSVLFTESRTIVFHIFAEEELHVGFKDGIETWPLLYRSRLEYHLYPITFPSDGNEANWKKLFKPCASQRLFLPLVLDESVDSVLYVDTDILFLSDIAEFWRLFGEFNSTQLSSLCIEHEDKRMGWYNRFGRHPYYGETGLNSGVMLMNLTRMRRASYKNDLTPKTMSWEEMLLPLYNKYRLNITWGDQDLLNIVFHHNPEMLHVFSCDRNYRPDHCMYGQLCQEAVADGVKIVHGNRGVYHNGKQPAFKAVYEAIKSYRFQRNLTEHLYMPMHQALSRTRSTYCGKESECILKGLRQSLKNLEK